MKFIVEESLGKLAKNLRILGYDTTLARSLSTDAIITLANRQSRVFLTRSRKIAKSQKKFSRRLLKSVQSEQQLLELKDMLQYRPELLLTRCLQCNSRLLTTTQTPANLPEYIKSHFQEFHYCPQCQKYYWRGSHYRQMQNKMQQIFMSTAKAEITETEKRQS